MFRIAWTLKYPLWNLPVMAMRVSATPSLRDAGNATFSRLRSPQFVKAEETQMTAVAPEPSGLVTANHVHALPATIETRLWLHDCSSTRYEVGHAYREARQNELSFSGARKRRSYAVTMLAHLEPVVEPSFSRPVADVVAAPASAARVARGAPVIRQLAGDGPTFLDRGGGR